MFDGFSHSVKGHSHEVSGLVCQDSSGCKITDRYAVAVVADGHGSKKHFRSDVGSRLAVESVIETIDRFYGDPDEFEKNFPKNHRMIIRNIEKQVVSVWNSKVTDHLNKNPVTVKELSKFNKDEFDQISPESYYGSTLIAGIGGIGFTFGIQIGDGSFVAVFNDGNPVTPMEYDESAPANITASICNQNAASMFKSFYSEKPLISMFASTDGLYTSFGSDSDFLDYHMILSGHLTKIKTFKTSVIKNLEKRSHFGTEDDISLSCVIDSEVLAENIDLINRKVAENKQRAAEKKAAIKREVMNRNRE